MGLFRSSHSLFLLIVLVSPSMAQERLSLQLEGGILFVPRHDDEYTDDFDNVTRYQNFEDSLILIEKGKSSSQQRSIYEALIGGELELFGK